MQPYLRFGWGFPLIEVPAADRERVEQTYDETILELQSIEDAWDEIKILNFPYPHAQDANSKWIELGAFKVPPPPSNEAIAETFEQLGIEPIKVRLFAWIYEC